MVLKPNTRWRSTTRTRARTSGAQRQYRWCSETPILNRGHFPNDDSVVKLLWLAIRDIEDKRARARAKEAGKPKGEPRTAPGYLVEGATTQGWKAALGALLIAFPDRLDNHIN